jgi:hypothetical protein
VRAWKRPATQAAHAVLDALPVLGFAVPTAQATQAAMEALPVLGL